MRSGNKVKVSALVVAGVMFLAGCGSAASTGTAAHNKKFTIALSNSFMGNGWRQQMEKIAEIWANRAPFKNEVNLEIVNTQNTPEAQSASINALVAKGVNAILVDASSPTALNPAIQRACHAGIVVVNFDQTVTAPCAYKLQPNFSGAAKEAAIWLGKTMGGHGELAVDTGLPGVPISQELASAIQNYVASHPSLKIVATFNSQYAEAPAGQAMASILATHPHIGGVWSQGYVDSIIRDFQNDHIPPVPMVGGTYNGDMVDCATVKGAQCFLYASPPGLSALALNEAVQILKGHKPLHKRTLIPLPVYTTNSVSIGAPTRKIVIGHNAFPNLSPGLGVPLSYPQFPVTPQQVLGSSGSKG